MDGPTAFVVLPDDPSLHEPLPPQYDVFISYKRDDCKHFARVLHIELTNMKYKVHKQRSCGTCAYSCC